MKFPYAPYRVEPTVAAPDRDRLYRPVIPVRFISANRDLAVRALLDTGADESYITEDIALKLGATPLSGETATILSASGEMHVWYTKLTLEVTDFNESYKLPMTLGVVTEDWSEMILGQHLTKKDPQRHQRRIDPVQPNHIQCFQCLRYRPFRQCIRERQFAVLKELPPQKTHLLPKPSVVRKRHHEASLPGMGV